MPDYLAWGWYSLNATILICLGVSTFCLLKVVPGLAKLEQRMFEARLGKIQKPTLLITGVLWTGRLIGFVFSILGIGAFAVCFGSMWLSALHALINFIPRAQYLGFAALVQQELSEGTLALRIASVTVLSTWLWTGYGFWKRKPKNSQTGLDLAADPLQRAKVLQEVWRHNAEAEKTFFVSDNAARSALKGVPFQLPPANIFFYHTLHLGLIALSVMFCWILVGTNQQIPELKLLSWLALFASHDVGLVFGYVYLLKGRLLGFHRTRIYASIIGLSALMSIAAWRVFFPIGLNSSLALSLIAAIATLLSVGIWLFEWASERFQHQSNRQIQETAGAAARGADSM
jgi:hypothetical protein